MFYLVRTRKTIIFLCLLMVLNLYNTVNFVEDSRALINGIFIFVIVLLLIFFISNFKFIIEEKRLLYKFTLFGIVWFTKIIAAENVKQIKMKKMPDNRMWIYLKKGRSFVVNDFKMKNIDDELAAFAERNEVDFIDTRPMYIHKQK